MERKMYKVFGVVITLLLVFSLAATFAVTTPVAAETQKWSEITMPGDKMQLLPDSDISTIAVTPDGTTLFAGVVINQSTSPEWTIVKSTDGGYTWKKVADYTAVTEPIVAIKISPNWADDGLLYVATTSDVYRYKGKTKVWTSMSASAYGTINSLDVTINADDDIAVLMGTSTDVYLYDEGWKDQNVYGTSDVNVLAVAFSPDYANDGIIVAIMNDGVNLRLRTESDIEANNWGGYISDAYFTYYNSSIGSRQSIQAVTACIAFPSDFSSSSTLFVGLNTNNNNEPFMMFGSGPTNQQGDAFKVSLVSSLMATSTVTDLNIRDTGTGTDVWSIAVSGDSSSATIICGLAFASQVPSAGILQAQVHLSTDSGASWSVAIKPPSGMVAGLTNPGICAPVVVIAPDFATSDIVYCANGYNSGTVMLSGVYASTNGGSIWNGRGLLDRTMMDITDISSLPDYGTSNTMYMVTNDSEGVMDGAVTAYIGLLWKTVDGGDKWEIICDMIPLASLGSAAGISEIRAVHIDKVAVVGETVFMSGSQDAIGLNPGVPYIIFRSTDGGSTFPTTIATRGPVEHMIAIDKDTLITANGSNIWLTTNSGAKWTKAEGDIVSTETITDIALNGNTLIAGTDAGNVYICEDYTLDFSFTQVGKTLAATGNATAAFDAQYATSNILYSAITGNATAGLYRIDVATSTTGTKWDVMPTNVTYNGNASTCGNFTSIACDNSGILWAICDVTDSGNTSDVKTGAAIRSVNPTETEVSDVKFELVLSGLDDVLNGSLRTDGGYVFAVGGTDDDGNALNNKLYTYTDTLIKVTLLSPTNGVTAAGDLLKDTSNARVVLQWADLAKAKTYQYQVALDSAFEGIVVQNSTIAGTQVEVSLYAGTKYYWRVRVSSGVDSQWSDTWSFTTPLGPSAEAPVLISPTAGQDDVILLPVLQWSGLASATQYELQLAQSCDFSGSNLIVDKTGSNALGAVTAFQMTQSLTAGTSYCWRVRAVSDLSSSAWSNTGSFITAPAPVAVEEEEGTPVWVWVVIVLSAVLLVSVVILIIRTRRA